MKKPLGLRGLVVVARSFCVAYLGAGRGNRTPMTLRSADFELPEILSTEYISVLFCSFYIIPESIDSS
ncbi:hypothetical protein BH10ACI4_BH10ACI4_35700 [soil metagenome]